MSYNVKLSGVMPALVTPFDADNAIDFDAFDNLLTHFREAGVTGWVPNGSTGEYFSQTTEERRSVLKFVKDFASEDEVLIAGTNAPATREVIEQTAMAKDIGYDNVLLAPPFYTRPTQEELIKHYETVLAEVDVNLVLYSYPLKDGSDISFELMDHFADNPRVIGIKESSGVVQRAVDAVRQLAAEMDGDGGGQQRQSSHSCPQGSSRDRNTHTEAQAQRERERDRAPFPTSAPKRAHMLANRTCR